MVRVNTPKKNVGSSDNHGHRFLAYLSLSTSLNFVPYHSSFFRPPSGPLSRWLPFDCRSDFARIFLSHYHIMREKCDRAVVTVCTGRRKMCGGRFRIGFCTRTYLNIYNENDKPYIRRTYLYVILL